MTTQPKTPLLSPPKMDQTSRTVVLYIPCYYIMKLQSHITAHLCSFAAPQGLAMNAVNDTSWVHRDVCETLGASARGQAGLPEGREGKGWR